MNPHHMDGEIAVFTTEQVDLLGSPEFFGYSKFYVIKFVVVAANGLVTPSPPW